MRLLHPHSRPRCPALHCPPHPHALSLALGLALLGWLPSHAIAAEPSAGADPHTLDALQVLRSFQ
ncbi:hypothetical protein, partial [Xanthomonas oryzae]|uniref:hypothetical protein n=1 Tax=Xanthomonas oryzae TaxID=347 RepID=UPI000B081F70